MRALVALPSASLTGSPRYQVPAPRPPPGPAVCSTQVKVLAGAVNNEHRIEQCGPTVHLANTKSLGPDALKHEVERLFGPLVEGGVDVIRDRESDAPRGFAFVTFQVSTTSPLSAPPPPASRARLCPPGTRRKAARCCVRVRAYVRACVRVCTWV